MFENQLYKTDALACNRYRAYVFKCLMKYEDNELAELNNNSTPKLISIVCLQFRIIRNRGSISS